MSDWGTILVGQKENLVGHSSVKESQILFVNDIVKCCHKKLAGQNVRPRLRFRRTLANFDQPLSDDRLLFAALILHSYIHFTSFPSTSIS